MAETLTLRSLSRAEYDALWKAQRQRDPDAAAVFRDLVAEAGECLLCAATVDPGAGGSTFLPDPALGGVMVARLCPSCAALPSQVRLHRTTRMLKAMYPKWRPARPGWKERNRR